MPTSSGWGAPAPAAATAGEPLCRNAVAAIDARTGDSALALSRPPPVSGQPASPAASSPKNASVQGEEKLRMKYPKLARHLLEHEPAKGGLDEDEVKAALRDLVSAESRNRKLKWTVVAMGVFLVLFVGATIGVSVAFALTSRDTTVQNGALTDTATGKLVATGPSYERGIPAIAAVEQTAQAELAAGRRRLLASGATSEDASAKTLDLSNMAPQRRQLLQTASAYPWVSPRSDLPSSNYTIDPTWFSNFSVPSYATVLVVGQDTSSDSIAALTTVNDYWCPTVSDMVVNRNNRDGFFLGLFYCNLVLQAQAVSSPAPRDFSCGCRVYVARTQCPETGDPNNPIDLNCAIDTTWKMIYNAGATCTIKTYSCPDTSADLAKWLALGKATYGDPGWVVTSGASVFSQAVSTVIDTTTVDTVSGSGVPDSSRRLLRNMDSVVRQSQDNTVVLTGGAELQSNSARRMLQWDTNPTSVTLDVHTTNTGSNPGSTWGR